MNIQMRRLCMGLGCVLLGLAASFCFSAGAANGQGRPPQAAKGLTKALEHVPEQALDKLLQPKGKGKGKQQGQGQGKGAGKGKGK